MTTVLDDLRLGARTLRRHARAYAAPFLMLTIGLAAATTMFSIVSAVLLDPLPYAHADRLSLVWDRVGESTRDVWLSPPEFADLRERARAFSELAAMTDRRYTLTNRSTPEELQAVAASPNLFELLGTQPRAGRLFRSGDDIHGSGFVTVLASPLAERLFGSAAAAVGQIVTLDGQGWTVVGVLPRAFSIWPPSSVFPKRVDLWVPIDSETYTRAGRNQNFLHVLARIRDGVTFEAAATDLTRVSSAINDEHPEQYKNRRWRMALVDFRQQLVGPSRPALLILFGSVGLLVLVACANVANLLLAHAASRTQEMAVRAALGASRARLLRQVLTESALLGLVATFAGIIAASWAVAWAAHSGPADVPRLAAASIDARTLVFSGCLALVTSLVFGAAPAWQLSHSSTADGLKEGLRGSTSGPRTRRYRSAFVIGELAIAVVLTIATGLLVKAFVGLTQVNTGFRADAVATARVRLPASSYPSPATRADFFRQLADQLGARSDVTVAGAVTQLPMSGAFLGSTFGVSGARSQDSEVEIRADLRGVTPRYFDTLGIKLVAGRGFAAHDSADKPGVAVIDETLARQFWPAGDAVGQHLRWVRTDERLEIVGVVVPVRHYGLASPALETVYRPYDQYAAIPEMYVEARSPLGVERAQGAIAEEVRRLDPNQPVSDVRKMEVLVEESLGQPRFNTELMILFAVVAVWLTTMGLYAVVSFSVAERTREIGVRVALGADSAAIVRLIFDDGARIIGIGIVLGAIGAAAAARTLGSILVGVSPLDPLVFSAALFMLLLVAVAATYIPARRAAQLDPTSALRR